MQCAVHQLGRKSVTTAERIIDAGGEVVVEARVRARALGPGRTRSEQTDHRRGAGVIAIRAEVVPG